MENSTKQTGVVKFFNKEKGFGFIKTEQGEDLFVHATGLIDEIKEKDIVQFDTIEGKKGLNAVKVSVVR